MSVEVFLICGSGLETEVSLYLRGETVLTREGGVLDNLNGVVDDADSLWGDGPGRAIPNNPQLITSIHVNI